MEAAERVVRRGAAEGRARNILNSKLDYRTRRPGYIDRENEVIVGLQIDAPLKRAIIPNGGLRLVLNAFKAYGYEPDPSVVETFSTHRKNNEGVF